MEHTVNRTEVITGLRNLADLLEANPTIPVPVTLQPGSILTMCVHDGEDFAAAVRAIPGQRSKGIDAQGDRYIDASLAGFRVRIHDLTRSCELVEDGVEEVVVEDIPDEVRERYRRTEQRPKFKRVCPPILAGSEVAS
jgi:hypothetical protein